MLEYLGLVARNAGGLLLGSVPGLVFTACCALLLWPLLWFAFFRRDAAPSKRNVRLSAGAILTGTTFVLAPALIMAALGDEYSNPGLVGVPFGLAVAGVIAMAVAAAVGCIGALAWYFVLRARGQQPDEVARHELWHRAARVGLFVGTAIWIPLTSAILFLLVGLFMTG